MQRRCLLLLAILTLAAGLPARAGDLELADPLDQALWTRGTEDFGHNAVIKVYPDLDLVLVIASNAGNLGDLTQAASHVLSDELEAILDR